MSFSLDTLEKLVRDGKITEAHNALLNAVEKGYPKEQARKIASLLRRVNDPEVALKVLNPVIRPTRKGAASATDIDKVEYAASLVRVGSLFESRWILSHIDLTKIPQGNLIMAFSLFAEWKYAEAVPYLRAYVSNPKTDVYDRLVGFVNLAAALIRVKEFNEAGTIIQMLLVDTEQNHPRLYANCLELLSQLCIFTKRFGDAEKSLRNADKVLKKSATLDVLFIEKWLAILGVMKNASDKNAIKELQNLRTKSVKMNHWETIRECDKYLSIALHDKELFKKVYFGTPFEDYRKRLVLDFPEKVEIPRNYTWDLNTGCSPKKEFSIFDATLDGEPTDLKVGQAAHRMLQVFSTDFYRPFRIGSLFGALHPGEYFNPISSPAKVHQTVFRFRQWLSDNQIPLEIKQEGWFYSLSGSGEVGIVISQIESRRHPLLRVLYSHFQEKPFSAKEAGMALQTPLRSIQRFLTSMSGEGYVEKTGTGTRIRYSIRRKSRTSSQSAA